MKIIKIGQTFDQWAAIAEHLEARGRCARDPDTLLEAADLMEAIGLTTTAAATRTEACTMRAELEAAS